MLIKNNLYKSLIFSDFHIVNYKNIKLIDYCVKFSSQFIINSIKPFKLLKEIKQLIKIIKYFKKINFLILEIHIFTLFSELIDLLKHKNKINLLYSNNNRELKIKNKRSKNFIILGSKNITLKQIKMFYSKHQYLLINVTVLINNAFGIYKITNKINNFKKLTYLFIIIKKICN